MRRRRAGKSRKKSCDFLIVLLKVGNLCGKITALHEDIRQTDSKIDKMVYDLYGLEEVDTTLKEISKTLEEIKKIVQK